MKKLKYVKAFENFGINENNTDEVDLKLTELKNPKVSELKKEMINNDLKVYFKFADKEFPYKATSTGSGWDQKSDKISHDSYLTWNGSPQGTISVGVGKSTNKAQDILKFIENNFKDGYVINKGNSGDYWEIKIVPENK